MPLTQDLIEKEVHYVYQYFQSSEFERKKPSKKIEAAVKRLIQDIKVIAKETRPLLKDETGIVTLTKRKTAAILADRVWCADTDVDLSIAFGNILPMEFRLRALFKLQHFFERAPTASITQPATRTQVESFEVEVERDLAFGLHDATGAVILPLYSSSSRRNSQYRSGDQLALISIVENLKIVDEERLTWPQVVEFRRDEVARTAYRRFVHWLDTEMAKKSIQFITDEIAGRLEKYEWALRKHGIKTVIGSLSNTLNPKSLISTSGVGVAVDLIVGEPIWTILATGGLLVGHAALSLAKALVGRRDLENANREIAYVQQLKETLGS